MNDLNSGLKGPSNRGASSAGMRNNALIGCRSACGGLPVAICSHCIAVSHLVGLSMESASV